MKKTASGAVLAAIMTASANAPVNAQTRTYATNGGYVACLSEALLDEATDAQVHKDQAWLNQLLKRGCFVVRDGLKLQLLDYGLMVSKIRVLLPDGDGVTLYAPSEIIKR